MGNLKLVDVSVEERINRPDKKAIAYADGTEEPDPNNKGKKREKLFWIPRSFFEDGTVQFEDGKLTMPEWLAIDKGLV